MMTLIAAAALAAQTAPVTQPHPGHAQMTHEQHDGMKKDCCKECCKDMVDKHSGHGTERGDAAQ